MAILKAKTKVDQQNSASIDRVAFGHAVVIGSSIAGLTAANVLTEHFERVTIIERDRLPDTTDFRRGVPQARHAHILPLRGLKLLEQQFPGLTDELLANGATSINESSEIAFFISGKWHELRRASDVASITCSRPLLEMSLYRRLIVKPNFHTLHGHDVTGLAVDSRGQHVTGVRLRNRQRAYSHETFLEADLVLDAGGRDSKAAQWLAHLGYVQPRETLVNSFPGYASRLYRRPDGFESDWQAMIIKPTPPDATRGGIIIPVEGDLWQVTLVGMTRDYPPTNGVDFLEFARSLPSSELYEAIKNAQPLTKPVGYRRTESRMRHYDKLPRHLEGFLVSGDAACYMNPVYAQGMTASALGSVVLDRCLTNQRHKTDLTGLARRFQKQLSQAVANIWQMTTREDRRWPETDVVETPDAAPVRRRQLTIPLSQILSKNMTSWR